MIYKLQKNSFGDNCGVAIVLENTLVPFDPANTDYQKFKSDVLAGAELKDADGNVMTAEQANEFISTLP